MARGPVLKRAIATNSSLIHPPQSRWRRGDNASWDDVVRLWTISECCRPSVAVVCCRLLWKVS